jgi:hypothetical protein
VADCVDGGHEPSTRFACSDREYPRLAGKSR